MKNFRDFITEHYACEKGTDWVEKHKNLSPKKMWKKCKNAYFLLWLLENIDIPHKELVRIQLHCLKPFANKDKLFKEAINKAEMWLCGVYNDSDLREIRDKLYDNDYQSEEDLLYEYYNCFLNFIELILFPGRGVIAGYKVNISAKKIRKSIPWKTVKKYYKKNA